MVPRTAATRSTLQDNEDAVLQREADDTAFVVDQIGNFLPFVVVNGGGMRGVANDTGQREPEHKGGGNGGGEKAG